MPSIYPILSHATELALKLSPLIKISCEIHLQVAEKALDMICDVTGMHSDLKSI